MTAPVSGPGVAATQATPSQPLPNVSARWKDHAWSRQWFAGSGSSSPNGNYVTVQRPSYLPNLLEHHGYNNDARWDLSGSALDQPAAGAAVDRYRRAFAALPEQPAGAEAIAADAFHGGKARAGEMLLKVDDRFFRFSTREATGALRDSADAVRGLAGVVRRLSTL